MPQTIPLDAIPNQEISVRLDGVRYDIALKDIGGGMMAATINRDSELLIENTRCVAGFPLLPYEYLWRGFGNFVFTNTVDGKIPYYTDFGVTCQLVYSSEAEILAVANG